MNSAVTVGAGSQRRISRRGPMRKMEPAATTGLPWPSARASAAAGSSIALDRWASGRARCGELGRRRAREGSAQSCRRSRSQNGASGSSMRAHVLVAHRAEQQRDARPSDVLQMRRQRARAGRVMSRIEQDLDVASHETLEPSRATQPRVRPVRIAASVIAIPWRAQLVEKRHRDRRVIALMPPARAQASRRSSDTQSAAHVNRAVVVVRHDPDGFRGAESSGRPAPRRRRRMTASAASGSGPQTSGTPGLMMPAFSRAMDSMRVPELGLMIEVDRGDGRRDRRDDIRRVEPSPQPDFEDRDLDTRAAEQLEGRRRRAFEERRRRVEDTASRSATRRPRCTVARRRGGRRSPPRGRR